MKKIIQFSSNTNRFFLKKVFNFDSLVKKLHQVIEAFPDPRTGKNISKSLKDAALVAFSIFFTKSPSFLFYQKSMQETEGQNNAATPFGINDIFSDNHIRNLLDEVEPFYIFPLFTFIFDGLNGHEKQDCETAAAKRWIKAYGPALKKIGVTITGDDLYCRQPFCELMLDKEWQRCAYFKKYLLS